MKVLVVPMGLIVPMGPIGLRDTPTAYPSSGSQLSATQNPRKVPTA